MTARTLLRVAAGLAGLAAAGLLYAWLGLAPIAASAGHWPVTRWLLSFSMRNAVETRSMLVKQPDLADPALVLKGAGHYATGCAPCHGAPGEARPLVVRQMTPKPPFLPKSAAHWDRRELFWIVKHGIKYTAMPAWPTRQRDDEVWAMVAFVERLPSLDPVRYRWLAYGGEGSQATAAHDPASDLAAVVASCARCHGPEGAGRGTGAFPRLNGQHRSYLLASLRAFAAGERYSGIMQPIAAALSDRTMRALADYYARQRSFGCDAGAVEPPDAPDAHGHEAVATTGDSAAALPLCDHCHRPRDFPHYSVYPRLAGQYADYLALQLELFRSGARGGTPYAGIMEHVARRLTDQQIDELSRRYARAALTGCRR